MSYDERDDEQQYGYSDGTENTSGSDANQGEYSYGEPANNQYESHEGSGNTTYDYS